MPNRASVTAVLVAAGLLAAACSRGAPPEEVAACRSFNDVMLAVEHARSLDRDSRVRLALEDFAEAAEESDSGTLRFEAEAMLRQWDWTLAPAYEDALDGGYEPGYATRHILDANRRWEGRAVMVAVACRDVGVGILHPMEEGCFPTEEDVDCPADGRDR